MLNHPMNDDLYHSMDMAESSSSLIPPMNQFDYCAGNLTKSQLEIELK